MKANLTDVQRNFLNLIFVGVTIRRRWASNDRGFYFVASAPNGDDVSIYNRLGKRSLTMNTLEGLTKKGFLTFTDIGHGMWTRTDKAVV